MAVSRGSDLGGRIDVCLRNERVERDGQQHHAQQKCATRRSGEATCLCSLSTRQQLGNQRLTAVNGSCVIAHSGAEQNSQSPSAPAKCKSSSGWAGAVQPGSFTRYFRPTNQKKQKNTPKAMYQ